MASSTLAWALHGAEFATTFILVEVLTGLLRITAARKLDESA